MKKLDSNRQFLYVRVCRYHGNPIIFSDGNKMNKGDSIVEIHLNNEWIYEMAAKARSEIHLAIWMIRAIEESLPKVALFIQNQKNAQEIKGIYSITMIYRGTEQLGFKVEDLPPGPFTYLTTRYLRILLSVMHPQGGKRLQKKSELLVPKQIAMSTQQLVNRYLVPHAAER